ncbi:hypothetical protein A33M_0528 [Rhodovulum sp. PH10]|uniref:hypothetical protein n=1 Tax=Rhodovulum sp. PH10 TaxID=1187851 RepID=UPI00027C2AC7|nr:hypothetical protein [Rhodovulum sp. PH10]EJW10070.1 hypothetical protein A33M_0528 [Rhodovulum sp. PH10]
MLERRKEPRSPSYLGARMTYSKAAMTAECIVRDRSDHGALVFVRGDCIPDTFDLAIPQRQLAFRVRTRWRSHDAAGVEILGECERKSERPQFPGERLLRLKTENERLRRRVRDLTE